MCIHVFSWDRRKNSIVIFNMDPVTGMYTFLWILIFPGKQWHIPAKNSSVYECKAHISCSKIGKNASCIYNMLKYEVINTQTVLNWLLSIWLELARQLWISEQWWCMYSTKQIHFFWISVFLKLVIVA